MRILLDCDGVLGDFASEVLWFCNVRGANYTLEDFTGFDLLKCLNLEHLQEKLDQHMIDSDYCRYMPVIAGAQEFVEALRRRRHEIVIVTSPYAAVPSWCHARVAWLWEHFRIPKADVIFAKRKELVVGHFLIDDKSENLQAFEEAGHGLPLCINQPWNQDYQGLRARTFQHALELI